MHQKELVENNRSYDCPKRTVETFANPCPICQYPLQLIKYFFVVSIKDTVETSTVGFQSLSKIVIFSVPSQLQVIYSI